MKRIITISSSELFLKKKNHNVLTTQFIEVIRNRLSKISKSITIQKDNNMINIANFDVSAEVEIIDKLSVLPGIDFVRTGWRFMMGMAPKDILAKVESFDLRSGESFKVTIKSDVKKIEKNLKEKYIGDIAEYFMEKHKLVVDLSNPDYDFEYKTTKKATYFYYKKIKGKGGFFQGGENNRVICLLSGGVDSILAILTMAYRGCKIITVSFSLEDNKEFMEKIQRVNEELQKTIEIEKCYIITVEELKQELMHLKEQNYRMIILKRVFLKISTLIADRENISALVMGDSLNQVASQTLPSIVCIDESTHLNVFRPLIGFAKIEIESKLKQFSKTLYSIAHSNVLELCGQFHPSTVITQPKIEKVKHIEEKHYLLNSLIELCYKRNMKKLVIKE